LRLDVHTSDGRTLAVETAGDEQGRPVLVHLGTPNSRLIYGPNASDAAERGIRLICYDRPGYGGSTPHAGRRVADCVADVRAICEELEITRAAMWGISGGGPHALACAALAGDLLAAVASLASLAPYNSPGLDYFAAMGQENVDDVALMLSDPVAARAKLEQDRQEYLSLGPSELERVLATLLSPADSAVLGGSLAEYLACAGRHGLAPGAEGWWEDGEAFIRPWGFELSAVGVPVLLVHGREDRFVPFAHGRWLADRIPGAEAWLLERDGHLTLLANRIAQVHEWLLARLEEG
jgi:pimeloyl-ACP methyl ester carboxylesterase